MKAQFVFENLNFERGEDPIKSIGLGKESYVNSLDWGYYQDYIKKDVLQRDALEWDLVDYKGYKILVWKTREADPGNPWEDWSALSSPVIKNLNKLYASPVVDSQSKERALDAIKRKIRKRIENKKGNYYDSHVSEALDFERGKDPKYSMGVGRTAIYKDVEDGIKDIVLNRILPPFSKHGISFHSQYKPATDENILVVEIDTEDWDNEDIYALKKSLDSELRFETEYLREYLHNIWDMILMNVKTKFPIVTLGILGRDIVRRKGSDQNSYIRIFYKKHD